ncbi:hypothetical protein WJ36_25755 [Burkholderia ubonensis]|uniref:hypothetical protein n=1 Tax=Burkholderia ubonensis TaxID=101571 RepID=UPI00075B872E|nr:hypothetical protein [Burkholderia ubonensis]KVG89103.1 hypothetical protein WJ36_25755 [Burkholderia ubonensis]KVQ12485.1 hypothetical protein WJ98_29065 [Burkholderia ubonensis]KVQ12554.1 hypothetical protein WJ98_29420 [Burkholderia ubonensis]
MTDILRTELIELQKVRSDLLKWKLLIVAGVGGTALGLSGQGSGQDSYLALAVIPLACAYVDLLCRHLSLRIEIIRSFIRSFIAGRVGESPVHEFERFYRDRKESWKKWSLESQALIGSTLILSVAVAVVGIKILASRDPHWCLMSWRAALFYGSSLMGIALTSWAEWQYKRLTKPSGTIDRSRTVSSNR